MKSCPACGQDLPVVRYGVKLTARRASIVDAVVANPGISARELAIRLGGSVNTIKVLINNINDKLCETDYRIRGRQFRGYRVIKVGDPLPAALARVETLR